DIIDLEATYSGPFARPAGEADGAEEEFVPEHAPPPVNGSPHIAAAPPHGVNGHSHSRPPLSESDGGPGGEPREYQSEENFDEDEDLENSLSLAAMEAELKLKVLETFDSIATEYEKLRKLQDQHVERKLADDALSPQQEKRSKKLRDAVIQD